MSPVPNRNFASRSCGCCLLVAAIACVITTAAYAEPLSIAAKRISGGIDLNGKLDEPAWTEARVITLTQQSPSPGAETRYRTGVRVLVSPETIYVGFRCHDPHPNLSAAPGFSILRRLKVISMKAAFSLIAVAFVAILVFDGSPNSGKSTLKKVSVIDLPGPVGKRFDYLTIDFEDNYLLASHLAAGLLYVIDVKTNRVLKAIPDVPGIEGVEYVPELKKAYTSDWYENKVGVVDLRQMKVTAKIPVDDKPDGSAYAAPFHKLYVSNERGKTESAIDVTTDKVVRTIRFDSETGMPQYDPVSRKVLVNLQDQDTIAEIDPATDTVSARYPVADCKANHGMVVDPDHRRAFLVCEESDRMAVFDLDKHRTIATIAIPEGGDVIEYDPGLKRIYVACSSGVIAVIQQDDPDHYRKLQDFPVEQRVHSIAVDPRTHRVYAPEQQENGKPTARMIVYEAIP
jgi:DNA-binding beta-propeller fold protein YncE